jgi:hypothetical protein
VGGDDSLDSVVLVDIVVNQWYDDVVDVGVQVLADHFTLVNDLSVLWHVYFLILSSMTESNGVEQLGILVSGHVLLIDLSDWVDLLVELFLNVLFVLYGLVENLDVVLMSLELSLTFDFLDGVVVVSLGDNFSGVLNSLVNVALGEVDLSSSVLVRVVESTISSSNGLRSS